MWWRKERETVRLRYGWQLCLGASRGGYFGFFLYRLSFTEIEYEGQLSLNVQLEDDAQILDEVVVTALGIEKKESSLPYATQLITGGELVRAQGF